MKIVAFLQSPSGYVLSPKELERYEKDQVWHRQMLRQSMTGNRLYQAFGDLYDKIWWDNVIPRDTINADVKHVDRIIIEQKPDLILTFGNIATEAIEDAIAAINTETMSCHHPNARHRTQAHLDEFAMKVRNLVREHSLNESASH